RMFPALKSELNVDLTRRQKYIPPYGHRLRMIADIKFHNSGGRKGRSRDAQEDAHPPRLTLHWGTVDAESGLSPQTETHQQHI
ncbi:hypothetical protein CEXT_324651, partial [Caerostris extrusa]